MMLSISATIYLYYIYLYLPTIYCRVSAASSVQGVCETVSRLLFLSMSWCRQVPGFTSLAPTVQVSALWSANIFQVLRYFWCSGCAAADCVAGAGGAGAGAVLPAPGPRRHPRHGRHTAAGNAVLVLYLYLHCSIVCCVWCIAVCAGRPPGGQDERGAGAQPRDQPRLHPQLRRAGQRPRPLQHRVRLPQTLCPLQIQ